MRMSHGRRRRFASRCSGRAIALPLRQFQRQVLDFHRLARRHHGDPVAQVFQLAHIAGQIEAAEKLHRRFAHALGFHAQLARALHQKVAHQDGDILAPLPQTGQAQPDHVQAVIQVFTEQAVAHALLEVLVRGRNDAHVGLHRLVPADAIEMAIGQHAQQARLQVERHVADFIKEQSAVLGLLEAAPARRLSARKCPAFMAEQFGLQQILRDRRRIQGNEGLRRARTVLVQRTRHELLAGTRFARDEHRHIRLRQTADGAEDFLHGRRLAEDFRRFRRARFDAGLAQALFQRAADQLDSLVDVKRFGQVFEGAALEGRDGRIEVGKGRDDDDRQAGKARLDRLQQFQAGGARHADIRHEHLRRVKFQCRDGVARIGKTLGGEVFPRQGFFQHPAD